MPSDLDQEAKKKWRELVDLVDPNTDDAELLGNYCRTYSSLIGVRAEKTREIKAGTFETMVPGRDKSKQLNPLLTAENRMVASLNRMLRTLGLVPNREQQDARKKVRPDRPPPPGMTGPEPAYGWPIAIALCEGPTIMPEQEDLERQWDEWLKTYGYGALTRHDSK